MMADQEQPTPAARAAGARDAHREPPRRYDDEISLRELYLILRRGLPLIVGLAALAAVAVGAWLWLRPDVYESEATVVSSPTTVQLQEQGTLGFNPTSAIPFATYEDLALSRGTMEATLEALGDDAAAVGSFRALQGAAEVEQLTGPTNGNSNAPLTVAHRIRWDDPELAARIADVWAQTTVEQVRNTLLANLAPARENTVATIEQRRTELEAAEDAWQAFLESDYDELGFRHEALLSRITQIDSRLAALDSEIAVAQGRREVLLAQVGAGNGEAAVDEATLDLLEAQGALDGEAAAQLRGLAAPVTGTPQDVATLLASAQLQQASVALAGLLQEREHLSAGLETYEAQADELRARLAELETERGRLQRELQTATNALNAVASIEPALAFVADLTPGNTRILNDAQVPVEPTGPSTLLIAALAAIVTAMAATVFVFLREAVREPTPTR